LRLLLPRLAQDATVILTTSGTHDAAEKTIIAPPLHADARFVAHPERAPNRDPHPLIAGGRTYSSSKLCNVLTARALAAHADTTARRLSAEIVAISSRVHDDVRFNHHSKHRPR
jgi:hypothetical protein